MMSAYFTSLFLLVTSVSPIIDIARQSLIANSDRWFTWLVVSSIVVGVGVCLEGPEATITLKRWYRHWKGVEVPPENEKSFAIPASYLGLLLVIFGVAGEGVFEFLSSNAETALRAHDEQVLADTISEAGDAATAAIRAKAAADAAETKAETVGKEADQAEAKVVAVDRRADLLNTQIAATMYAFSMRNLQSLASRDQVIEQLKQFRGKTVFVRSYRYMGDVDGFRVCKMVIDLAHSAGINPVDQCSSLVPGDTPATGIQVCGPNDQEMLSLSRALNPIDVGSTCTWGNVPHSPDLLISIGSKALMGIGQTFQTEDAAKSTGVAKSHRASKPKAKTLTLWKPNGTTTQIHRTTFGT